MCAALLDNYPHHYSFFWGICSISRFLLLRIGASKNILHSLQSTYHSPSVMSRYRQGEHLSPIAVENLSFSPVTRQEIMNRARSNCEHCASRGRAAKGEEVHHIIPKEVLQHLKRNGDPAIDLSEIIHTPDNGVFLCKDCHNGAHYQAWLSQNWSLYVEFRKKIRQGAAPDLRTAFFFSQGPSIEENRNQILQLRAQTQAGKKARQRYSVALPSQPAQRTQPAKRPQPVSSQQSDVHGLFRAWSQLGIGGGSEETPKTSPTQRPLPKKRR